MHQAPGQHRRAHAERELMLALQASDWGWNDVQIKALELYSGGKCAIAAGSPVVHGEAMQTQYHAGA